MKRKFADTGIQLSLFDNYREKSDKELIRDLTNGADAMSDVWEGEYRLERLFNRLTPHRRRIAVAAVELYKRRETGRRAFVAVRCSHDVYRLMYPLVGDLRNEEFWVMAMNQSSRIIAKKRISVGGMTCAVVDVRMVMRILVELGATQFAAIHNHPSGNCMPSHEDRQLTNKLRDAANLFDIRMTDHVIIADNNYYSFCDEGLL